MLLYWAALYSAVFLIFLPTLTNSHLACLGLTAEWCCCWFLNTTPLSVAALLLDNISHSIMHKVLYVERQIIDIKINSFNNQLMCHLVQLCRLVIQWVDCISPDSYVYWSSICFFFPQDGFVTVRKRDLEKLTTEVMQLREFLPRVLNGDLTEMLRKSRAAQTRTHIWSLNH